MPKTQSLLRPPISYKLNDIQMEQSTNSRGF